MAEDYPIYCAACRHRKVCKYTDIVMKQEEAIQKIGQSTSVGPGRPSISCGYKDVEIDCINESELEYIFLCMDRICPVIETFGRYEDGARCRLKRDQIYKKLRDLVKNKE